MKKKYLFGLLMMVCLLVIIPTNTNAKTEEDISSCAECVDENRDAICDECNKFIIDESYFSGIKSDMKACGSEVRYSFAGTPSPDYTYMLRYSYNALLDDGSSSYITNTGWTKAFNHYSSLTIPKLINGDGSSNVIDKYNTYSITIRLIDNASGKIVPNSETTITFNNIDFVDHEDVNPKDHKCDLCNEKVTDCGDLDDDHKCDICGTELSSCVDENRDAICDICNKFIIDESYFSGIKSDMKVCVTGVTARFRVTFAGSPSPDYYYQIKSAYKMLLKDGTYWNHGFNWIYRDSGIDFYIDNGVPVSSPIVKFEKCDLTVRLVEKASGKVLNDTERTVTFNDIYFVNHVDVNPKDHKCDYGCGKDFGTCEDVNPKDHKCDYGCRKDFGTCEDVNPKDHKCDYGCRKDFGTCEDVNPKDHKCDYGCGKELSICEDVNPVDHICDICGAEMSYCADENPKDHICDICKKSMGTKCEDTDNDHKCDICDIEMTTCEDTDNDHKCDLCNEKVTDCGDLDDDHKCDICNIEMTNCMDENSDGFCDICGVSLLEDTEPDEETTTEEDEETTVVEDDDNDKTDNTKKAPKTGDESNVVFYSVILVLSVLFMSILIIKRKELK